MCMKAVTTVVFLTGNFCFVVKMKFFSYIFFISARKFNVRHLTMFTSDFLTKRNVNLMEMLVIKEEEANTVELQWIEHLWDHGKLFETWVVRATEG